MDFGKICQFDNIPHSSPVTSGMSRGLMLCPLLFVGYINNLDKNVQGRIADGIKMYALVKS